jgi:hypothetical protein
VIDGKGFLEGTVNIASEGFYTLGGFYFLLIFRHCSGTRMQNLNGLHSCKDSKVRTVELPPHKSFSGWDLSRYLNKWELIEEKLKAELAR